MSRDSYACLMPEHFEPTGQNCDECGKPITTRILSVIAYHGQCPISAPGRNAGPPAARGSAAASPTTRI
jgi:hypothetical protein